MKLLNVDIVQCEDWYAAYHLGKKVIEYREKHGGLGEMLMELCSKNVVHVIGYTYYNKSGTDDESTELFPALLSTLKEANA